MKWIMNDRGTILNDPIFNNAKTSLLETSVKKLYEDDEHEEEETCRLRYDNYDESIIKTGVKFSIFKGIFYSSISSIFFSTCTVIVKLLQDIHPGELALFRFIGITILSIPPLFYCRVNPFGPKELRFYLMLRGLCGSTSLFLRFCAIRYLHIADASVIIFSVPIVVTVFAYIFLKEPCGIFQSFLVGLTVIGLCMTVKVPFLFGEHNNNLLLNQTYKNITYTNSFQDYSSYNIYGIIAALFSTIFTAFSYVFIRKAKSAHHSVILFNFGWISIIETCILTAIFYGYSSPKTYNEWLLIIALMIFSYLGQVLLTKSLQIENAGPVSFVRSAVDIILAFIWQIYLFKEVPDFWSVSGAFIVTMCVILTGLRKWLISMPEYSALRMRFHFIK